MGEIALAAAREDAKVQETLRRLTEQQTLAQEIDFANREYGLKMEAFEREKAALNKFGKDYQNSLKAIQDKEKQQTQAHEDNLTAIKTRAEADRNARILSAERTATEEMSRSLTSLILGHQSAGQIIEQYAEQSAGALIRLAIASLDANERTKISDAGKAARDAFKGAMAAFPPPVNLIAAPIAGAAAFSTMMGFAGGTDRVPGIGMGDTVPAMLTQARASSPAALWTGYADWFGRAAWAAGKRSICTIGPLSTSRPSTADGVKGVLDKHSDEFSRHFQKELRRMNW